LAISWALGQTSLTHFGQASVTPRIDKLNIRLGRV